MQAATLQVIKGDRGAQAPNSDAFEKLDLNKFVELLVAEMQAQDPLNPMSNEEILSQISQIRSIAATTRLTSTLDGVLLGQSIATAASLIGRRVTGLDADGGKVTGRVERVTVEGGTATLHIGQQRVTLKNVAEILPADSGNAGSRTHRKHGGKRVMGLTSSLTTALTGLTAAETTIDVVGNNLANSNTVGFKASQANFATQFAQTMSLGSAPTEESGGTNPRQTGLGTMVADISADFGQGTIEISSNPTDMAIQGDGFFIVQGQQGERLYTRNGVFKMNASNEIVTITGNRVLGFGVDDRFQIQSTTLVPLTIPLGSAAVAQSTANVYLQGTLTPNGDVATTAERIQTGILGNGAYTAPEAALDRSQSLAPYLLGPPPTTITGQAIGGGGMTPGATYLYRFLYAPRRTRPARRPPFPPSAKGALRTRCR